MENRYTGVFEHVGAWWVGYVEELPGCNVQEASLEEARESLKEAIQLIIQSNRELARRDAEGHDVVREALAILVEWSGPTSSAISVPTVANSSGREVGTPSTGTRSIERAALSPAMPRS